MTGRTLSHYQVLEKLGEGGMGVVYKARDLELGRLVALKVLTAEAMASEDRKRRFIQEARAASALNHPNIITIYEIAHVDGLDCIVMEYVDGRPLKSLIPPQGLPAREAAGYAAQIAGALAVAHGAGIVHRDIKPANILVTAAGLAKVLDFGLAKLTERASLSDTDLTATSGPRSEATERGVILGTVNYMSPEQAEGKEVDARSDVFSLGVVIYEMLSGRRPFQGDSQLSTLMAILRETPPPVEDAELNRIVRRALEKDREARYSSGAEMARALGEYRQAQASGAIRAVDLAERIRRPRVAIPAAVALLAAIGAGAWGWQRAARGRWARETAIPEVARLAAQGKYPAAVDLAREADNYAPGDPRLVKLWPEISRRISVDTSPAGADVHFKPYAAPDSEWRYLGKSPLDRVVIPEGHYLWRLSKEGYETTHGVAWLSTHQLAFKLDPSGTVPAEMVSVPSADFSKGINGLGALGPYPLGHYLIDRFEVTNKMFKEFVDRGGYQKKEFWKEPFVRGKRTLSFDEAMGEFADKTGRPGPATWEAGSYPEGQEEYPVSGVSWYEAAAYAEFAGKKLPTIVHWYRAAEVLAGEYIVPRSNFAGKGLARVGTYKGAGPFGTYDMAGNVKEWCWNQTGDGLRFILGGSWNEPVYQFTDPDARAPFDRSATNGFRCVRYTAAIGEALLAPRQRNYRDYSKEKPVSEEVFRAYRSNFTYDRTDLKATVDAVDESSPHWVKQKVSFNAAYGGERITAYLFLPKAGPAPFQVVAYHASAGAYGAPSSANLVEMERIDFIIRSGRALLYPVLKGMYERR
ncbi:MAG: protein kinase, partial [Acidobacteria bacterium]|nr:protein kinase [Acidobacteriota bacterium]